MAHLCFLYSETNFGLENGWIGRKERLVRNEPIKLIVTWFDPTPHTCSLSWFLTSTLTRVSWYQHDGHVNSHRTRSIAEVSPMCTALLCSLCWALVFWAIHHYDNLTALWRARKCIYAKLQSEHKTYDLRPSAEQDLRTCRRSFGLRGWEENFIHHF